MLYHRSLKSTAAAALIALTAVGGCYHSTQLAATWRDPASPRLAFRRPVTVFVTKSETMRRTFEDKLANQFPNATPSYRVLATTYTDGVAIRKELADRGYDGVIMMRVVNVEAQVTYTAGSYWYGAAPYYSFAGYWRNAWGYPYDPGFVTDQVVSIETQIYSLTSDKLIFAARSETTNPKSVNKLGNSVIKHIVNELRKDGLIAVVPCDNPPACRLESSASE
jgi:hypothetical protein